LDIIRLAACNGNSTFGQWAGRSADIADDALLKAIIDNRTVYAPRHAGVRADLIAAGDAAVDRMDWIRRCPGRCRWISMRSKCAVPSMDCQDHSREGGRSASLLIWPCLKICSSRVSVTVARTDCHRLS